MKQLSLIGLFLFCGMGCLSSQEIKGTVSHENQKQFSDRTLGQHFVEAHIPTAEERMAMRKSKYLKQEALLMMIDTSTVISQKRKMRLRQDVVHKPYSERLTKFLQLYEKPKEPLTVAQNEK
ncbi:Hypothetical protein I595_305 [Croceitalea dokdonensis DOKDO 023]|uniref:Uncharacterized protein n=1 Tax=Croceitalea dokdonensis DOKDO 023 TaxID=1300341 RepID=A0A0P7B422_9FLAO|nr:hypothetical protein [Croceitalea dokdonensis]KPM33402.1 Hypothetical protein I595_305 [Croceitalea dokdonensis DOKDO 023]